MENKINVAELLKDCPKGMELDCTICEKVYFDEVTPRLIKCFVKTDDVYNTIYFHHNGAYINIQNAKCVIFPKGKTTWEGFVPPCKFKNGDVIVFENHWGPFISIFKENVTERNGFIGHCVLDVDDNKFNVKDSASYFNEARLAMKREKEQLFRAIEKNGYKWNPETKTLEKLQPKFKVGYKIRHKEDKNKTVITITGIKDNYYLIQFYNVNKCDYQNEKVLFKDQDQYELVSNKFDIKTLKPFDKVLVRTKTFTPIWTINFYDGYQPNQSFTPFGVTGGKYFQQCIPYEGNEHLRGTTDDCDEYFKTWK